MVEQKSVSKEKVLELLKQFLKDNPNPYLYGYRKSYYSKDDLEKEKDVFFSEIWRIGGLTGGNCWGGNADQSISAEDPSEFTQLDSFLEKYFPKITFLQYKKLLPLIKTQDFSVSEYYGNYTEYRISYVKFKDVAECISEMDLD